MRSGSGTLLGRIPLSAARYLEGPANTPDELPAKHYAGRYGRCSSSEERRPPSFEARPRQMTCRQETMDSPLNRRLFRAHDIFRPTQRRLAIWKPDGGNGQQDRVSYLVFRNSFSQSVPNRGMHCAFGTIPCGNADLYQAPRTRVQRTRAVAFLAQLLKSLPDLRMASLKTLCPLGEFGSHWGNLLSFSIFSRGKYIRSGSLGDAESRFFRAGLQRHLRTIAARADADHFPQDFSQLACRMTEETST